MLELIVALRKMCGFDMEIGLMHESEVIFVLRKSSE
jgi:hypothetical protein